MRHRKHAQAGLSCITVNKSVLPRHALPSSPPSLLVLPEEERRGSVFSETCPRVVQVALL